MTVWITAVYKDDELLSVGGPFPDEQKADEWAIETFPGLPDWEAMKLHERGETLWLECGHNIVSETLNGEVVYCSVCESYQSVLEIDTE